MELAGKLLADIDHVAVKGHDAHHEANGKCHSQKHFKQRHSRPTRPCGAAGRAHVSRHSLDFREPPRRLTDPPKPWRRRSVATGASPWKCTSHRKSPRRRAIDAFNRPHPGALEDATRQPRACARGYHPPRRAGQSPRRLPEERSHVCLSSRHGIPSNRSHGVSDDKAKSPGASRPNFPGPRAYSPAKSEGIIAHIQEMSTK